MVIYNKKEGTIVKKKEKQTICPICNKKLSFLKYTIKDGIKVCSDHVVIEARILPTKDIEQQLTVEGLKEVINIRQQGIAEHQSEVDNFVAVKQIGNFVAFDDNQKKWATLSSFLGNVEQIYNYSDVVSFELLEDGESVAKGGLGRALVGGALFSGVGAIVGGVTGKRKTTGICNSLRLKLTMDNIYDPVVYVDFITSKTKKDGFTYKTLLNSAQECLSMFQLICEKYNKEEEEPKKSSTTTADEIRQFKKLLDEDIITQEEFNKKKKELLDL